MGLTYTLICCGVGIGSAPCAVWEWTSDANTCYMCTKEVVPYREKMEGHTTGCVYTFVCAR